MNASILADGKSILYEEKKNSTGENLSQGEKSQAENQEEMIIWQNCVGRQQPIR